MTSSSSRLDSGEASHRPGVLARVLGDGESPVWWGVHLCSIGGCRVRVHLVTLLFVASLLAYAVWSGPGLLYVSTGLFGLAIVAIGHEAVRGHALVRWMGQRPSDVIFWPLGAVWIVQGPGRRERSIVGGVIGFGAIIGIGGVAGTAFALIAGSADLLVFDPLRPALAAGQIQSGSTLGTVGLVALWQVYAGSIYFGACHCLPVLPLNGGRLVAGMTGRIDLAAQIGLVPALILTVGGLMAGLPLLAAVGLCTGVFCWDRWQMHRFSIDPAGVDHWRRALAASDDEIAPDVPPIPSEDREELERILAKISSEGMGSLTRRERQSLRSATSRLRAR